jgi:hypothetical protein
MAWCENLSEALALVAAIDPIAPGSTTTTVTSDKIDMKDVRRVLFVISVGAIGAADTLDFTVYSGDATATITTSCGAITQLTGADDNKQVIVEVKGESLTAGHRYITGTMKMVAAGAAGLFVGSAIALADVARFEPISTIKPDLTTVDEIKVI